MSEQQNMELLLADASRILKEKNEIKARFLKTFEKEVAGLPNWGFKRTLYYLHGYSERFERVEYKLECAVITDKLYMAMYDLFEEQEM
jgi:hypothetical protein